MGVDTKIYIPKDARIKDIATVIGILSGLEYKWEYGHKWIHVEGADVQGIVELPNCATIDIKGDLIDGENHHHVLLHYETSGNSRIKKNYNLLMPPSTCFWIAIGIELCKFFGGMIDFNDCDLKKVDRKFVSPRKDNAPENNKAWDDFQKEMSEIKPLTIKDLLQYQKYASYPMKELA